tara:strand:+ start:2501 stop:2875 length:375 start_codon:yes stop_codon:yes gene_type:complete
MKSKFIALIAITAGLATASGTPEKEEKRKSRGEPGISAPFSKEWLKKFDKNKDGKLCEEERKVAAETRKKMLLKRFDKNKDGKLCEEEKKAAAEAVRKRRAGRKPEGQRAKLERKKGKKDSKKK